MRLVTFVADGPRLGAETEAGIVDLAAAHRQARGEHPALCSMRALIAAGESGLDAARFAERFALADGAGEFVQPSAHTILLPPLPDPAALRCCSAFPGHYSAAYRTVTKWRTGTAPDHVEPPAAFFAAPHYYKGNHLNLTGPGDEIVWPSYARWLDFELELALIVGSGAVDVAEDDWESHVFGWSIFNDVSARYPLLDELALGTGPAKGKDFDTGNILGPCIVTADAFDGSKAVGIARVNGVECGRASSAEMAHSWGAILAHRSRAERLHPGEIITSGTFSGCSGIDHDRPLAPGDLVSLEIEGIGTLTNRVADGSQ